MSQKLSSVRGHGSVLLIHWKLRTLRKGSIPRETEQEGSRRSCGTSGIVILTGWDSARTQGAEEAPHLHVTQIFILREQESVIGKV